MFIKKKDTIFNNNKAFTIIEILISLTLVAFLTSMAYATLMSVFGENLKSSARKLAGTIRYVYNQSLIRNKPMRIVYDFKENKYWAEIASSNLLLISEEDADKMDSDELEQEREKIDKSFSQINEKILPEKTLDGSVAFKSIYSPFKGELIEEGRAYTHFFPQGMIEASIIHLVSGEQVYSLVIEPMMGIARIKDEYVEPEF